MNIPYPVSSIPLKHPDAHVHGFHLVSPHYRPTQIRPERTSASTSEHDADSLAEREAEFRARQRAETEYNLKPSFAARRRPDSEVHPRYAPRAYLSGAADSGRRYSDDDTDDDSDVSDHYPKRYARV